MTETIGAVSTADDLNRQRAADMPYCPSAELIAANAALTAAKIRAARAAREVDERRGQPGPGARQQPRRTGKQVKDK